MAREKTKGVYFVMSPEEEELFERRMAQTGIKNRSAFIRKMCIDGHVIVFDSKLLNEIGRLIRITANNGNQIAHRANAGGGIYRNDIAEMIELLTEVRADFGTLLALLSDVASAKPGK
ncbi:MAG: MobC family plasmid mobilization relaxosome protein [Oscillospiraceae bacterium]|nr:MobC family plasmid mobilization relaxosome protein [Oscillospiraceae bacterium]